MSSRILKIRGPFDGENVLVLLNEEDGESQERVDKNDAEGDRVAQGS